MYRWCKKFVGPLYVSRCACDVCNIFNAVIFYAQYSLLRAFEREIEIEENEQQQLRQTQLHTQTHTRCPVHRNQMHLANIWCV